MGRLGDNGWAAVITKANEVLESQPDLQPPTVADLDRFKGKVGNLNNNLATDSS